MIEIAIAVLCIGFIALLIGGLRKVTELEHQIAHVQRLNFLMDENNAKGRDRDTKYHENNLREVETKLANSQQYMNTQLYKDHAALCELAEVLGYTQISPTLHWARKPKTK